MARRSKPPKVNRVIDNVNAREEVVAPPGLLYQVFGKEILERWRQRKTSPREETGERE